MNDGAIAVKAGKAEGWATVNSYVAAAIEEGLELYRRYQTLEAQLEERKNVIREYVVGLNVDSKTVKLTLKDGSRAEVTLEDKAEIVDPAGIKKFLGERYDDLVNEKTEYKPRSALVAMASDKEVPEAKRAQLLTLLTVKPGKPGVKFEKVKV